MLYVSKNTAQVPKPLPE